LNYIIFNFSCIDFKGAELNGLPHEENLVLFLSKTRVRARGKRDTGEVNEGKNKLEI
jgi:hypothetical protein